MRRLSGLAMLILMLGAAGSARADERLWSWCHGCPPSSYCGLNYWTPMAWKFCANRHPPTNQYTYARDLHPEIPLHQEPIVLRCPAVPPAQYPFPPAMLPLPMTMAPPQPKANE